MDKETILQCQKGIEAFWRARAKAEDLSIGQYLRLAKEDARYLAEYGEEGIRFGAFGWTDLKLRYTPEKGFYLYSNKMSTEDFLNFQRFFISELQRYNLPYTEESGSEEE